MYLSYEEYQEYGGTLDESTFNSYDFEAEALVDYYTFDRLKRDNAVPYEVKRLVYTLIGIAERKASSLSLGVNSSTTETSDVYVKRQANDGVDTTYNSMDASSLYSLCKGEANSAIQRFLAGVMNEVGHKVLYRGLYPGE